MDPFAATKAFARSVSTVDTQDKLKEALAQICDHMGIRYFALSHHVDFASAPSAVRIHNYPDGWQEWYDAHKLSLSDPIHRASHCTAQGFYWRDVPRLIAMTKSDHRLLSRGRQVGLGEGVTIPAHVPGEAKGSCSFVAQTGQPLPDDILPVAQSIGMFAFEGARRIARKKRGLPAVKVSERQRQCIALAGRGFSNRKIARSLGIGEQTVIEHLREARAKLCVGTRTELVVRLLVDGALCFDDVTVFEGR